MEYISVKENKCSLVSQESNLMSTVAGTDKNDGDTYLCICGMTIGKELADNHVCNTRGIGDWVIYLRR